MSWTNRVHHMSRTPPLRQVREAAQNLADQAGISPGKSRVAFQTVTDVVILASAVVGGTLGAVHLWKTLFPKHKNEQHSPEPAGIDHSPPRHRGPHTAMVFADGHGPYEEDGARSR